MAQPLSCLKLLGGHDPLESLDQIFLTDRLLQEISPSRQVAKLGRDFSGNYQYTDIRPPLVNKTGELEPIDGARHVYIRQDGIDIGTAFQEIERFIRVLRLNYPEFSILKDLNLSQPHKRFILDEEDHRTVENLAAWLH
jgi:hypothetical protein